MLDKQTHIRSFFAAAALVAAFLLVLTFFSKARGHDIYTDWKQPGNGISCCSEKDCKPVKAKFERGAWWAVHHETNQWVEVPNDKIISEKSPDGEAHLCAMGPFIWCFVKPNFGS